MRPAYVDPPVSAKAVRSSRPSRPGYGPKKKRRTYKKSQYVLYSIPEEPEWECEDSEAGTWSLPSSYPSSLHSRTSADSWSLSSSSSSSCSSISDKDTKQNFWRRMFDRQKQSATLLPPDDSSVLKEIPAVKKTPASRSASEPVQKKRVVAYSLYSENTKQEDDDDDDDECPW